MSQSSLTERRLVEHLRLGSREAFGQIYVRYKGSLCNYCYWLVKEKDRAEDIVHETFLKVWNNIGTLDDSSSFRSWLFTIARNQALLFLRDRRPFEELTDESSSENDDPLHALISTELSDSISSLLNALSPAYRELIVLRVYEGLSYAEIASVTGLSLSAVRVHLYRARKALARLYNEQYGDKDDG
ncbi:MAG: RNA polymerase sigma factor [Ignavibacteria bacterium]|nr:RNA polymerase sigma factor [Ignavibacteria bacterium]